MAVGADHDQLGLLVPRDLGDLLAGRTGRARDLGVDSLRAQRGETIGQALRAVGAHRRGDLAELLEDVVVDVLDRGVVGERVNQHELRVVQGGERGGAINRLLARRRQVGTGDDRGQGHGGVPISSTRFAPSYSM